MATVTFNSAKYPLGVDMLNDEQFTFPQSGDVTSVTGTSTLLRLNYANTAFDEFGGVDLGADGNGQLSNGTVNSWRFVGGDAVQVFQITGLNVASSVLTNAQNNDNFSQFLETALAGADTITGTNGNDFLTAFAGNDILIGRGGDDILNGSSNADEASYAFDPAGVRASIADEDIAVDGTKILADTAQDGFGGTDTLIGIDHLTGSGFDDVLIGNAGNNRLDGGAGGDRIIGGEGSDTIAGGDGVDFADYSRDLAGVEINLSDATVALDGGGTLAAHSAVDGFGDTDTLAGVENAIGTVLADEIHAGAATTAIFGAGGIDIIYDAAGDQRIVGGGGDDIVSLAGGGKDTIAIGLKIEAGDVLTGFGTKAGADQDVVNLDELFDNLGVAVGSRAALLQFTDTGADVDLMGDLDNNGSFETKVVTFIGIANTAQLTIGADVVVTG